MSIATEKNKRSTERFMLVRLTPARFVSGDLVFDGVHAYTMTFPYPIAKVQLNGSDLVKLEDLPGIGAWWHDESTGELKIRLASPPDSESAVVVVFYYIFLTGDKTRVARETPIDAATPLRPWLPRLDEYPTLRQSSSNNLFGVFTIDATSINFRNADHFFEQFLTDNDSFTGKAVDIWYCLNDVSNITAAYRGNVSGVSSGMGILTLEIFDQFSLLESLPFMGDTADEAIYLEGSTYTSIHDKDIGKPVRFVMGKYSYTRYQPLERDLTKDVWFHKAGKYYEGEEAVCVDYNPSLSNTVNRTWMLCRTKSGLKTQTFGSLISHSAISVTITEPDGSSTFESGREFVVASHNVEEGEWIRVNRDGNINWERVVLLQDSGANKKIVTRRIDAAGTSVTLVSGTLSPPSIEVRRGYESGADTTDFLTPSSFSYSQTDTSGGNKSIKIALSTTYESVHGRSASDYINPDVDKIIYRVRTADESLTHAEAAKLLCEGVGLEIDQDTFDQADLDYSANALFSVPFITETEYQNSRHYLEALLNSTMGFLYITPDNKVGYKLFKAPIGGSSVTKKEVIRDSMSLRVDFYDVYDQIIARNPHVARLSPDDPALPSESASSKKAKYLHGISKVKDFDHVLEKIGDRLDLMLAVYSNRKTFYSYQSTIGALETALADDLTLMSEVSGADSDKNLIVTSVTKGADTIDIEATDLIGVE